jgi:hypothetical protein
MSGRDVDIMKLPNILCPQKSEPYVTALFPLSRFEENGQSRVLGAALIWIGRAVWSVQYASARHLPDRT